MQKIASAFTKLLTVLCKDKSDQFPAPNIRATANRQWQKLAGNVELLTVSGCCACQQRGAGLRCTTLAQPLSHSVTYTIVALFLPIALLIPATQIQYRPVYYDGIRGKLLYDFHCKSKCQNLPLLIILPRQEAEKAVLWTPPHTATLCSSRRWRGTVAGSQVAGQ